jgi:hypothetical protein
MSLSDQPLYCYAFLYNETFGSPDEVKSMLDKNKHVRNWHRYLPYCYFVVSELSADDLHETLKGDIKDRPKARILVLDTATDRQGWLPRTAWDLMNNPSPAD